VNQVSGQRQVRGVNRIRQDDPTDFTEVYAQHARAIHRYLARRLGTENADELTDVRADVGE